MSCTVAIVIKYYLSHRTGSIVNRTWT